MKPYDLSFIIIEYHSLDDIQTCVNSIYENCKDLSYEIIVTSNSAYPSEKREVILKEFPELKWSFHEKNLGFAKAMNAGISKASGNSIVIINSDVKINNGSIFSAYQYLMSQPNIGLIGPKIIDNEGNIQDSCRKFMTPLDLLSRIMYRVFLRKDVILNKSFDYSKIQMVDWVIGAFMMVKRALLKKVGFLDENYFLYVEDMDWCKRFWNNGYKVVYFPELVVQYKGDRKSVSPLISKRFINKYTIYHFRSYLRFIKKHGLFLKK